MLDSAIQVNLFLIGFCRRLLADIPDERLAEQPVADVNHPAWVLGHLANELVAFVLSGHMGVHLGQLSSWRRMIGLPPLF